ncbi:MAG: hypothetical protein ACFFDF_13015 [Candidatus Odinarchaeota archaeon]
MSSYLDVSKNSGLESILNNIETAFNKYIENYNGNFYTTNFIIEMNEFLSQLPQEMINQYYWKRFESQKKPSLYLTSINRIVKFFEYEDRYRVIKPDNLDTFLIK